MGGSCDRYNLFPQNANFNNSAYKVYFENVLRRANRDGKEDRLDRAIEDLDNVIRDGECLIKGTVPSSCIN